MELQRVRVKGAGRWLGRTKKVGKKYPGNIALFHKYPPEVWIAKEPVRNERGIVWQDRIGLIYPLLEVAL